MIGRDSDDDINGYGKLPWIFGVILVGVLIYCMFQFAQPIS
jgi:hypothetical protein